MTITAKFRSVCPNCQGAIEAGEAVIWERGSKARHPQCQAAAPRPQPKRIAVEDQGVYVLQDGTVCRVQASKQNKMRTYAKRWAEIHGTRMTQNGIWAHGEWHYEQGLVRTVADQGRKMTLDEAKRFLLRYGQCVKCGHTLKDAKSIANAAENGGLGPVCVKYFSEQS